MREDVVKELLTVFERNYVFKVQYFLCNGGFMSKAVLRYLDQKNIPFIGRGKHCKKRKYSEEKGGLDKVAGYEVRTYVETMKRPGEKTQRYILQSSAKHPPVEDAKGIYGARFRIENGYRHAKKFKLRTASEKLERYFWAFAQFLECIWELVRLLCKIVKCELKFAGQDWAVDLLLEILPGKA